PPAVRDVFVYVTFDLRSGFPSYDWALGECLRVVLIRPPGSPPDWMEAAADRTVVDFSNEAHWSSAIWELIAVLAGPSKLPAPLERVPPSPPYFVLHPELDRSREALTGATDYRVLQLVGPLGTGKTTLAIAIGRDCAIRGRFDEVLWLTKDD